MAPKADPKKKKEESTESSEEESYEYETESSSEKPAAKKADEKKPAAAAPAAAGKEAAKPPPKKAESSEEESDEDEDESYEYETESEEKKKDDKKAAPAAAAAKADDKKPATAAPKADDKKKEAEKDEDDEDDDDDDEEEYEYEYESEYESEEEAKPAAKGDDKKPAAAAAAAAKPAAAAGKPDDKKEAAPAKTGGSTASTTPAAKASPPASSGGTMVAAAPAAAAAPLTGKDVAAGFFGELLGSFILCYVIFQFRLQTADSSSQEPSGGVISHALVQAFAVGAVTAAFGHLSQAQFNPAVTFAMVVLRQTPILTGGAYILLQFAGAILAGLLAWGLAPPSTQFLLAQPGQAEQQPTYGTGFAAPYACIFQGNKANFTTAGQFDASQCWQEGFGAEIIGTFIFTLIYLMTYVAGHGEVPWLSVALGLAINVFAFHTTSNAYFNPARAIGGAVFTFNYSWTNFWIYIIGPFIGAIISIIFFGLIFQTKNDKSKGENLFKH